MAFPMSCGMQSTPVALTQAQPDHVHPCARAPVPVASGTGVEVNKDGTTDVLRRLRPTPVVPTHTQPNCEPPSADALAPVTIATGVAMNSD